MAEAGSTAEVERVEGGMSRQRGWRRENIPVPEQHLIGLGIALVLHRARPRPIGAGPAARTAGTILVLSGAALAGWGTRAAGTTHLDRPDRLVTRGPYEVSRNPMYVGWSAAYIGCALLFATQWPLILLPGVAAAIHREVRGEESRLEERFGSEYRRYLREVRRYL